MVVERRAAPTVRASTSQSIVEASAPSAALTREVPLWGQCGLNSHEKCAGDAQCICKDQWWSQCRIPLNGSWFPSGENWECHGLQADATNSSLPSSSGALQEGSRKSTASSFGLRLPPTGQPVSDAAKTTSVEGASSSQSSSQASSNIGTAPLLSPTHPAAMPSPARIWTSVAIPSSQAGGAKYGNITTTARPVVSSTERSSNHSSDSLVANTSFDSKLSASLTNISLITTSSTTPSPTTLRSAPSTSATFSSANLSTTSSSSASAFASLRATAFANPFVISVLAQLSSSSASANKPQTTSGSPSATLANGQLQPSRTSMLPNLACPAGSAVGDESRPSISDPAAMQACNPNGAQIPENSSATTDSSTAPGASSLTATDPERNKTYLDPAAAADQLQHCRNFAAHQYQLCWAVLNVTGYIQDWVSFNQRKCADEDMGFADCFLYLEVGAGANCTSFTGRSQCPSPDSKTFVNRINGAHAYYVAFNIWNIQNWFFTYYMAIGGANGLAADNVATIARTLNLPLPKSIPILDVLAGLAFAFGLLSPSGYAAGLPMLGQKIEGFAAQAPGEYLLRAMQNSPTLVKNLMEKGDISDTNVQTAELSSSLARIVSQLQNNVQNSIVLVMSNFSLFFDFVQDGYFSTQIANLNTVTQNVTLALNTYLVSQALQDDKVIITRALNTDINELQHNGSAYKYDTGCSGNGYDEWGMCGSWWYDSTNRISYGLESLKDMLNNYTDPLESLFNQGITTPELLFMNSQFCADAAGSTQGNAPGTTLSTTTGVWNTECISNMKICTWDTVNLDVFHEFTDCDRESAFAMEGCGAPMEIVQAVVPASYIGPWLTGWEFQGIVCNKWSKGMGSPG
ncbi:MAG: hypothetical protein Q9201_001275 [Fulgogasparrea decipioides]